MFGLPVVLNVSDVISLVVAAVALGSAAVLGLWYRAKVNKIVSEIEGTAYTAGVGRKMTQEEVAELHHWIEECKKEEEEKHKNPHTGYSWNISIDEIVKTKYGEIWRDGKKVMESDGNGGIRVVGLFTFDPYERDKFVVVPYPVRK